MARHRFGSTFRCMEISNRMEAAMEATLTSATTALGLRPLRATSLRVSAGRVLRRLQTAIVDGSNHPCWQTSHPTASFSLLPRREQNRLLDAGR